MGVLQLIHLLIVDLLHSKSDPDTSNINDYTLDDAVNSSTAPASNCKKTITYSYTNTIVQLVILLMIMV